MAIHLVVITAENLNACIYLLYFCGFSRMTKGVSVPRPYFTAPNVLHHRYVFSRTGDVIHPVLRYKVWALETKYRKAILNAFCKTHSLFAAVIDVSQ